MLRRIVLHAGSITVMAMLVGCQKPTTDEATAPGQTPEPVAQSSRPPAVETPAPAPAQTPSPEPPATAVAEPPAKPIDGTAEPLPKENYVPNPPESPRVHVVQTGETLYELARRYYNDQRQWRRIYEANRQRIQDPNDIRAGMKLIIP